MLSKNIYGKIEKEAQKYFAGASGCHDWAHVERVRALALHLAQKEGADQEIVKLAAILHDISRKEEMEKKGKICHAEKGALLARKILSKYKLPEETIEKIVHCIETHRYRNENKPATLEARIIFDADKLDSIGAVGIGRDFLFAGHSGSGTMYTGNEKKLAKEAKDHAFSKEDSAVLEYEFKLKHIKDKMLTKEGKRMAKERDKFMKVFFDRFWQEIKGKK